jgi:uncharacterized membrane protein YdjX (TVP38/TMEM64 family)
MSRRFRIWLVPAFLLSGIILPFLLWGNTFETVLSPGSLRVFFQENLHFAWLIGIGLLVADLFLPIPGTVVMSALGWLYGPLIGGLVSSAGLFLSAQLAYHLSRRLGRPVAVRLAGEENLIAAADWFSRTGGACVALSRCLPVLSEAIACLAGLSRFSSREFLAASLLGGVPAGFTFAYIGHIGREHSGMATALSAVFPVLLWLVYRRVASAGRRGSRTVMTVSDPASHERTGCDPVG